jgi:hypothetical protein
MSSKFLETNVITDLLKFFLSHTEDCIQYFPEGVIRHQKFPMEIDSKRPKSGDFFFIKKDTAKHWRYDRHDYMKMHQNSLSTRENWSYLQINGKKVL